MKENEKYIIEGKALDRYYNFNTTLIEFSKMFSYSDGDDRSIVIVGASFLDTILENILIEFFPEDSETNNLFGTYTSKARMLFCLGLIEKVVYEDLKRIGKIRNAFAHDLYASFDSPNIVAWCKDLKWHHISLTEYIPKEATVRDLYQVSVHQLITNLSGVIGVARSEKRSIKKNF